MFNCSRKNIIYFLFKVRYRYIYILYILRLLRSVNLLKSYSELYNLVSAGWTGLRVSVPPSRLTPFARGKVCDCVPCLAQENPRLHSVHTAHMSPHLTPDSAAPSWLERSRSQSLMSD